MINCSDSDSDSTFQDTSNNLIKTNILSVLMLFVIRIFIGDIEGRLRSQAAHSLTKQPRSRGLLATLACSTIMDFVRVGAINHF